MGLGAAVRLGWLRISCACQLACPPVVPPRSGRDTREADHTAHTYQGFSDLDMLGSRTPGVWPV